jgi:hypothetical protein
MKDILKKKTKDLFDKAKKVDIKEKAKQVGAIVTGGVLTSLAMGSGPKAAQMNKQVDVLNKTEAIAQVEYENLNRQQIDSFKEYREAEKGSGINVKMKEFYKQDLQKRVENQNKYFDDAISKLEVEIADLKCRAQVDGDPGGLRFGQVPSAWVGQAETRLEKKKAEKSSYLAETQSKLSNLNSVSDEDIAKYVKENSSDFLQASDSETKATYLKLEELRAKGDSNLDNTSAALKNKGEEISNLQMQKANLKPAQDNANNVNTIAYTVGGVAGSFAFKKKKKPGEE